MPSQAPTIRNGGTCATDGALQVLHTYIHTNKFFIIYIYILNEMNMLNLIGLIGLGLGQNGLGIGLVLSNVVLVLVLSCKNLRGLGLET